MKVSTERKRTSAVTISVENLKRGSDQAKEFIFLNYYNDFISIATRILKCKEDAEDLVSESLIKIFNKVHQLNNPEQFAGWCRSIIVRDCYTYIRGRKLESGLELFDKQVIDDFTKAFDIHLVKQELEKLPPGYRTVIDLHCIQGYSGPELSVILKIDPGTVRSQLAKGRKALKKRLGYEY